MLVYVLDSTKNSIIYHAINRPGDNFVVDAAGSVEVALASIFKKPYDLIVLSQTSGRTSVYDLAEEIKHTKLKKAPSIAIVDDNPTVTARLASTLRGRSVFTFNFSQLDKLSDLIQEAR